MVNRLWNSIIFRKKEREHEGTEWEVNILADGWYEVKIPSYFTKFGRKMRKTSGHTSISNWEDIQTTIISNILTERDNAHTYMRLFTYDQISIENLPGLSKKCIIERAPTREKNANLFFIPDCQDRQVWRTFFSITTSEHAGKMLFSLDYKPDNWQEKIALMFEISQKLRTSYLKNFRHELERCYCLCYSADNNLIIATLELSDIRMLSILKTITDKEGFDQVIKR